MIPTPHISAKKGDFAPTVLMPGDPLRAKFIAEHFLQETILINNVRGIQGYTGKYNGTKVSVMASGMGMPSMGIYSYELFNFYGVDNIIRIGSAGAISDKLNLMDIVIALGACTNSNYQNSFNLTGNFAPIASYNLVEKTQNILSKMGIVPAIGNVLSSDTFYSDKNDLEIWQKMNVLAVEMEAAALYMNAARSGKNALCICTISDCPLKGTSLDADKRQTAFTDMIKIALELSCNL